MNAGTGMKFPKCLKNYVAYGIPAIIIVIYLKGYYDKFAGLGTAALAGWMIVALVLLGFVFYCATAKKKVKTVGGARISARPENNKRCNYV